MGSEESVDWLGACTEYALASRPVGEPPHASWDLDVGDLQSWMRAVQLCRACPFIQQCRQRRRDLFPHTYPAGVIWAGAAFSETGKPLDASGLRRLAAARQGKVSTRPAARTGRATG